MRPILSMLTLMAAVLPLTFCSCANASGSKKKSGETAAASAATMETPAKRNVNAKPYRLQVVNEFPHDVTSYTQGLFFYKGQMYESTGMNGLSTFRRVDIASGEPTFRLDFDRKYFLEGSVEKDGSIYILTWMNNVAFVYDAETLEYKASYAYPREGWGITTDGKELITSDGSSKLFFMNDRFQTQRTVTVRLNGRALTGLNELEYIDGKVWANVYLTDMIVIIDPSDGAVTGVIDCSGLLPDELRTPDTDVLNGIAYNPADGKIYLTGKNWCRLYEVKVIE